MSLFSYVRYILPWHIRENRYLSLLLRCSSSLLLAATKDAQHLLRSISHTRQVSMSSIICLVSCSITYFENSLIIIKIFGTAELSCVYISKSEDDSERIILKRCKLSFIISIKSARSFDYTFSLIVLRRNYQPWTTVLEILYALAFVYVRIALMYSAIILVINGSSDASQKGEISVSLCEIL